MNGSYVYFYENGQPKKEKQMINGLENGQYFEWYEDGTIWVEGVYQNGVKANTWKWYNSNGELETIGTAEAMGDSIK